MSWPLWYQFYVAMRDAGSQFLIEDDTLHISPPLRSPAWQGDIHAAIEEHYWQLKDHAVAMKQQDDVLRARLRDALAKFLKASGADT